MSRIELSLSRRGSRLRVSRASAPEVCCCCSGRQSGSPLYKGPVERSRGRLARATLRSADRSGFSESHSDRWLLPHQPSASRGPTVCQDSSQIGCEKSISLSFFLSLARLPLIKNEPPPPPLLRSVGSPGTDLFGVLVGSNQSNLMHLPPASYFLFAAAAAAISAPQIQLTRVVKSGFFYLVLFLCNNAQQQWAPLIRLAVET